MIPVSDIVDVNPGVIGTGGSPLALNGMILSDNAYLPTGAVQSFNTAEAVGDYFGTDSTEYDLAAIYFAGFDNSTAKPGTLYFCPFVTDARAAWLESGSFEGWTLAELQDIAAGVLTFSLNGTPITSASINLSGASSFSDAAALITTAIDDNVTCTWDAVLSKFVLTTTSTGASATLTFCTGSASEDLKFTQAAGATLSQGANEDTADSAMTLAITETQNWCCFMLTTQDTDTVTKEDFAVWANAQDSRYMFVAWDTDEQAIVADSDCFGNTCKTAQYNGVMCVSGDTAAATAQDTTLEIVTRNLAAFVLGTVASIDFTRTNGRITAAFKHQSGMYYTVSDSQLADNLLANGYSFYGQYSEVDNDFVFLYDGNLPGEWKWLDTFVDQVRMSSDFRLAEMSYLTQVNAVPYNQSGYNELRAVLLDPIQSHINFGSIRPGVVLSNAQKSAVNVAAGLDVASTIEQTGWYLQILDPGAQVRGLRQSPIINFWYTDGGAVQKLSIASIDIM